MNKVIASVTAWSLRHAANGVAPCQGYYGEAFCPKTPRGQLAGRQLAGGFKLCYLAFKADLKARKETQRYWRYYLRTQCCDRCLAEQKPSTHILSYKDLSDNAAHLLTSFNHEMYLRSTPPSEVSPWSEVEGWRLETTAFDFMHNTYLGTARGHIPSVLKALQLLGYWHSPGQSDDAFLRRVSKEMRACCKLKGTLVLRGNGFPFLV